MDLREMYRKLEVGKLYRAKIPKPPGPWGSGTICVYKHMREAPTNDDAEVCRIKDGEVFLILDKPAEKPTQDFIEVKVLFGDKIGWVDINEATSALISTFELLV